MDQIEHAHSAVALLNWHRNKLTKSEDLNVLAAGFTATGRLCRDKQRDPILRLRRAMDAVTEALNGQRREARIRPQSKRCRKFGNAIEMTGKPDIVEQLRQLPRRPKKPDELKAALLSLECEIPRYNADRDTISVKKPGRKKASRMSISALLRAIEGGKHRRIWGNRSCRQNRLTAKPGTPPNRTTATSSLKAKMTAPPACYGVGAICRRCN